MDKTFKYGVHLRSTIDVYEGIVALHKEGANCFQFFLRGPRRKVKEISESKQDMIKDIKTYANKNKITLFIHAPYSLNMAQVFKPTSWWVQSLVREIEYAEILGVRGCVLHVGKYQTLPYELAFENMYKSVMSVIDQTPDTDVKILIETPAGQGTEMAVTLDEFARLYNSFPEKYQKRVKTCLDTCHIFNVGVDLTKEKNVEEYFNKFDKLIGLKNLELIHLNDSENEVGSRLDRHAEVGLGKIGVKGLHAVFKIAKKNNIPVIMETPGDTHEAELKLLKKWDES